MIRERVAWLLVRALWRLVRPATALALAVAAAPVTLVAVACAAAAWWRGWPPRRLYVAAAWSLPMVAVWLAATWLRAGSGAAQQRPRPVASVPYSRLRSHQDGAGGACRSSDRAGAA